METLIYKAEPYDPNRIGTFGSASNMLIRQHCFPETYSREDTLVGMWNDQNHEHFFDSLKKHLGFTSMKNSKSIEWFRAADENEVESFITDFMKMNEKMKWTGWRITISVDKGHTRWSLELFAKKNPDTCVYSEDNAPNVLPGRRDS